MTAYGKKKNWKNCQGNGTEKVPGPHGFTAGFYRSFWGQTGALLFKLLQAGEREEKPLHLLYEDTAALTSKSAMSVGIRISYKGHQS